MLALLVGRAHDDGIGAEEDGEKRRRHAEVQAGHVLGYAVHVVGRAAKPTQFLGNEEKVQTDLRPQQFLDKTKGKLVLLVEFETHLGRQLLLAERPDGVEQHLE